MRPTSLACAEMTFRFLGFEGQRDALNQGQGVLDDVCQLQQA